MKNELELELEGDVATAQVCRDGTIMNYAISEHVENAGVHSGDATLVLPAQKLYVQTQKQVRDAASGEAPSTTVSVRRR